MCEMDVQLKSRHEYTTRMHSSRMHTARLLTLSQYALWPGGCTCPRGGVPVRGVYLPGGVTCPGGVPAWGVTCPGGTCLGSVPAGGVLARGGVPARGCTCPGDVPAWGSTCPGTPIHPNVDRQTPVKTQPSQTSFAGGKNQTQIQLPYL